MKNKREGVEVLLIFVTIGFIAALATGVGAFVDGHSAAAAGLLTTAACFGILLLILVGMYRSRNSE